MNTVIKKTGTLYALVALSAAFFSCSGLATDAGGGTSEPTVPGAPTAPSFPSRGTPHLLTRFEDCNESLSAIQEEAVANMEAYLDGYYQCYDDYAYPDDAGYEGDSSDAATTGAASSGSSGGAEEVSFTGTNLQEGGVDESDVVKTDGGTIFVATNSGVDAFRAWPLDEFSKIASYDFDDPVSGLFLTDGTLVALTQGYDPESYVYRTTATLLDVGDSANPRAIGKTWVDGNFVTARLANGVLRVVTGGVGLHYPELAYPEYDSDRHAVACGDSGEAGAMMIALDAELAEAKERLATEIRSTAIGDWLPGYSADGEERRPAECGSLLTDASEDGVFTAVYSYPLEGGDPEIAFVNGYAFEVYASTAGIYLAANYGDGWDGEDSSDIHRFCLDGEALQSYCGSANISGHLLDRFSMGEYEGTLRVATTVGHVARSGSSSVYSNVHTLDVTGETLTPLATLSGIAPGEEIYAARFIGDKGYVVTFEKVDPLFVVNLEDPAAPAIEGELVIPGYSTYLHPLDDGHLIGIGKDAEDAGSFSWYQGVKLSVFDVTDGDNPSVVDDELIGSRGTESEALYDSHAFTFDAASGLLALPISLYVGGSGGSDTGDFAYNGVHLYSVSATGVEPLAEIALAGESWDTVPYRTLIIGDGEERGLYVVTASRIYRADMASYAVSGEEVLTDSLGGTSYYYW